MKLFLVFFGGVKLFVCTREILVQLICSRVERVSKMQCTGESECTCVRVRLSVQAEGL